MAFIIFGGDRKERFGGARDVQGYADDLEYSARIAKEYVTQHAPDAWAHVFSIAEKEIVWSTFTDRKGCIHMDKGVGNG